MVELREYTDQNNRVPFGEWFRRLNSEAARKVTTALYRMALGHFSNVKSVGGGVFEYRINFGPGYRVYFGKDGPQLVVLVGGGNKQRQEKDIALATFGGRSTEQLRKNVTKRTDHGIDAKFQGNHSSTSEA
jgi:putative addiction module killer protein